MDKSDKYEDSVKDTKYQQLSVQLFGKSTSKGFRGPFVDLEMSQKSSKIVTRSNPMKARSSANRCLICYSQISPLETKQAVMKKGWDDFYSFLSILQEPMFSQNGNRSRFNFAVYQLRNEESNCAILCANCTTACGKLLEVHRKMKKLEEEVKEFQAKFLNAIKLSKAIAEKEADKSEKVGTSLNKVVDQLRTCLIGGTEKWEGIKDKWMDYVSLEEETVRNDSNEPQMEMDNVQRPEEVIIKIEDELNVNSLESEMNCGDDDDVNTFLDADNVIIPSCNFDADVNMMESEMNCWSDDDNTTNYVDYNETGANCSSNNNQQCKTRNSAKKRKLNGKNHQNVQEGFKVTWVDAGDNKLICCGVEIRKNENGTLSCISCENNGVAKEPVKNKKTMSVHIKKEHLAMTDSHTCDKCDAKFFYPFQLAAHILGKHEGGLQCNICGERFRHQSSLFSHKKVKHQGIKPHFCEQCGKGFATVRDLTVHLRVHTGERPFVCHVCATSFTQRQNMRQHIKKKHPADAQEQQVKQEV